MRVPLAPPAVAADPPARPSDVERSALRRAILLTVAYADVFDYPLTRREVHRYLIGTTASPSTLEGMLDDDPELRSRLSRTSEFVHLPGREALAHTRRRRAAASARLWPVARRYAGLIARLPLVRFVAVTGALAMDNAEPDDDIDLFILTRPARVWLCRLLVLAVVRVAALRGRRVCPNFLLSADRLPLAERNLFTAHELAQMVPLARTRWGDAFRDANRWAEEMLPNAFTPGPGDHRRAPEPALAAIASRVLASRIFDGLERWEMERKIRRLRARGAREGGSFAFSSEECRGHFSAHEARVLAAFGAHRLELARSDRR
jgi:hypothetical protein